MFFRIRLGAYTRRFDKGGNNMRATHNDDLIYELPMLALRGLVLFPDMMLHFDVGRKKSIEALNAAMAYFATSMRWNLTPRSLK